MAAPQAVVAAAIPKTSGKIIQALKKLGREHDQARRQQILDAGHKAFLKWFTLTARKILLKKIVLPKQTQKFMDRHKEELQELYPETKNDIKERAA